MGFKMGIKGALRGFSKIGQKTTGVINKLGEKVSGAVGRLRTTGTQLNQGFQSIKTGVNNIPSINDKIINGAKVIAKKTGGVTNVLRKASDITDRILTGATRMGAGGIPVVGGFVTGLQKAADVAHSGAVRLDSARDSAAKKINKYDQESHSTISDIEKINRRKRQEMAAQGGVDESFV